MLLRQKSLLTVLALPFILHPCRAQNGTKLQPPAAGYDYSANWQACDSLATYYLQAGDTSMAIYYYQQYVDKHPEENYQKNILLRQLKLYNRRESFYLTDH